MKRNRQLPSTASRRSFLGATGGLLAAAGTTRLVAAARPEPVRVAVIGTGARGSDLLRSLTTIEGCEVAAICDDYPPHLEKAAVYAGPAAASFADYRQLLDRIKPQAVVIAVPLYLHAQLAGDAIAAGADVLLEKTMCHTVAQCRRLVEQVERSGCVFQIGLQRRANPIYQQAAAMVKAGLLGQITAIKSQWHRNSNWRRPVPVPPGDARWQELEFRLNWRLYKRFSGGLMAELGSHQMDVANWLLGTTPRRVLASGGIDYWRDGRDVADNVFCIYEYELPAAPPHGDAAAAEIAAQKRTVRVSYSSLSSNAYEGAAELVLGTRGSLYLTSEKGLFYREKLPDDPGWLKPGNIENAAVLTAGKTLKLSNSPWAHRGEPLEIDLLESDDTRDQLVSFLDHVRRRDRATLCDARTGLADAATILMANEAVETGAAVAYPA
jgi:predicted dehydrogenase